MKEKDTQNIYAYLTFNGNCKEAMTFYKHCLGGKLVLQTIRECPLSKNLPEDIKNIVLHATLTNENFVLIGTDLVEEEGLVKGNSLSLMLYCSSEENIKSYFNKLSVGGRQTQPLIRNHYGILFGNLVDRYGNHWLLNCNPK
ncbi:MAG TPA: VOC family protein [Pseudosphingobacterium sp.]|nr:VOC family protein [Pseudosphingobacterium sp.]